MNHFIKKGKRVLPFFICFLGKISMADTKSLNNT